jgi:alginate O-acetyltransferase complex protein AlgI
MKNLMENGAKSGPRRGWVFYDGQCHYCTTAARRFDSAFGRRGFEFVPLQKPWVERRLGLTSDTTPDEMKVLTTNGQMRGGADAVLFLSRQVWWGWPLHAASNFPGMRHLLTWAYRWVANHRGCNHSLCAVPKPRRWPGWMPLAALPALTLLVRSRVEPWLFMWLMAGSIFLGCKWLTFWRAQKQSPRFSSMRAVGYLFLWPGMDAAAFLGSGSANDSIARSSANLKSARRDACVSVLNFLFGAGLLFVLARLVSNPLLAGWIGMAGIVFILHFGLFALAGVLWRMSGVNARPIMNAPIKATSLSEFWGRRWNGAFNQLVLDSFFRPLYRALGPVRATLTAFLFSGLIHELVISVPAGGGFGLPTAYFLLQGCGVVAQRGPLGRHLGIRRGIGGWGFTMLLTAGPAFWLFHPPFVRRVVLPFMQAIGAL